MAPHGDVIEPVQVQQPQGLCVVTSGDLDVMTRSAQARYHRLPSVRAYYFVYPPARLRSPGLRQLRDWMLAEAGD